MSASNLAPLGTGRRRKPSDQRLIAALAGGATLNEAAAIARVSRRTAARRSADPEFRAEIDAFRGNVLDRALDVLGTSTYDAAHVLHHIAVDVEQPASVRVTAARAILSLHLHWRDAFELAQRLDALERRARIRGSA